MDLGQSSSFWPKCKLAPFRILEVVVINTFLPLPPVPPSVVFSCRLFQCRIRSGHLTSVLCNCYTGARPRAAAWCQYHHYALQYAIYRYTYNSASMAKRTNRSLPLLLLQLPNEHNKRTHDNLVPRAPYSVPSTLHISWGVQCHDWIPRASLPVLGWAVVQIIQFSRSNPSTGLHGAGSCDGIRDVLGLCYATELCG